MKIDALLAVPAVLAELGARLAALRVQRNLTQAELAARAGLAKRTLERLETGHSVQLDSFVRLCRALELSDRLDALLPPEQASPLAQLQLRRPRRRRASGRRAAPATQPWTWDDRS